MTDLRDRIAALQIQPHASGFQQLQTPADQLIQRGERARRNHIHRHPQSRKNSFEALVVDFGLYSCRTRRFPQESRFLAVAFDQKSGAPKKVMPRRPHDKARKTAAASKIHPAARSGAIVRSWRESKTWRSQNSDTVLGATRLMLFCQRSKTALNRERRRAVSRETPSRAARASMSSIGLFIQRDARPERRAMRATPVRPGSFHQSVPHGQHSVAESN